MHVEVIFHMISSLKDGTFIAPERIRICNKILYYSKILEQTRSNFVQLRSMFQSIRSRIVGRLNIQLCPRFYPNIRSKYRGEELFHVRKERDPPGRVERTDAL